MEISLRVEQFHQSNFQDRFVEQHLFHNINDNAPSSDQSNAFGLAISPDGNTLYVATDTDDSIAVVNLLTNTVTTNIPLLQPYPLWTCD